MRTEPEDTRRLRRSRCMKPLEKKPNGGVDAAARFHSSIAGPVMMRNTLPPLASNDLSWVASESQALHFITSRIEKYQISCSERHVNVGFACVFPFDGAHFGRLVNPAGIGSATRRAIEAFRSPQNTPNISSVRFDKDMYVATSIGRRNHHNDISTLLFAPMIPDEVASLPIRGLAPRRVSAVSVVAYKMAAECIVQ
jgi:hypothetical protein